MEIMELQLEQRFHSHYLICGLFLIKAVVESVEATQATRSWIHPPQDPGLSES